MVAVFQAVSFLTACQKWLEMVYILYFSLIKSKKNDFYFDLYHYWNSQPLI